MKLEPLYNLLREHFPIRKRDWIDLLGEQSRRELPGLLRLPPVPREGRKKVLVYSIVPWSQGCVEHILATALRMRGHEVASVICGGALPDCEMHYYDFKRPPCEECVLSAQRLISAFGITPVLTTRYLDASDLTHARELTLGKSEEELLALSHRDIPVGRVARFQLNVFYQNFVVRTDASQKEQFRTFCTSAILLAETAHRLLEDQKPDIVLECDGKAFMYRPLYMTARRRGIPVVTWEEHAFDDEMKFVFNHDSYAGEIHLESVWDEESRRPLAGAMTARLDRYFERWRRAENTPFAYHQNTDRRPEFALESLGIPPGSRIICCFPNMIRDAAAFDRDVAFDSLIDWILQTVRFAQSRPDLHLVIRAHPAERCLPPEYAKYNRFFVCDEVRRNFPSLPANVHLVEGDSPVNTYTLIGLAEAVLVYSSTLGLECALLGRLACVLGDVHYRGKGFTMDIDSPESLWRFLSSGPPYERHISPAQMELARRYAVLWRFRHPFTMPFYAPNERTFSLPDFGTLAEGKHPVIDTLCRCILTGAPFIDVEGDKGSG